MLGSKLGRLLKFGYANLKTFDNLEAMNHHLAANQFSYTLVYFRANWNPNCALTDQHISEFASENPEVHCIKVDSDVAPKIAKHYGVRAEPEFVFCFYGDEVIRQIGPNKDGLKEKTTKMEQLSYNPEFQALESKWVPYGQKYETYRKQNLSAMYRENTSPV